jgi:hypothetical protein
VNHVKIRVIKAFSLLCRKEKSNLEFIHTCGIFTYPAALIYVHPLAKKADLLDSFNKELLQFQLESVEGRVNYGKL